MGKPISECTLRELKAKANFLKTASALIVTFALLLAAYMVYQLLTGGKVLIGALLPAMIAVLAGAIPSFAGLAAIKNEVEKRVNR
jgi:hypothetical protein